MTGLLKGGHSATPREMGLQRLQAFTAQAGKRYAQHRNTDVGPLAEPAVSQLSPFIRHRLITEVEVLQQVLAEHGPADAEKFVQEVFWRTYFKGYLEHRPGIWSRYRQRLAQLQSDIAENAAWAARYELAVGGQTGIEAFDTWALELQAEHYLHNHARMWFASIWIFTLELPWELGADFFMQHLLDGDPASNTLSWRWVAGLHTKGKHYLARSENIARFSNGRFPQTPGLNESAEPLQEPPSDLDTAHRPAAFTAAAVLSEPPAAGHALLLHEEDLHWPELVAGAETIAVLGPVGERCAGAWAPTVESFVSEACRSTAQLSGAALLPLRDQSAAPAAIAHWAQRHSVQRIVTPYAPTGPVQDALVAASVLLAAQNATIEIAQRDFDQVAWPHCRKGFFALRKRIPELLAALA